MNTDPSVLHFIMDAGLVVKIVLFILVLASVFTWMIIFQRVSLFKRTKKALTEFESAFWSGTSLDGLFAQFNEDNKANGVSSIFIAGLKEYKRYKARPNITPEAIMEGTMRAMRIAETKELERLESNLSFLATVGSTSPYVGLFGTVWGIMTSFQALGTMQQATIAMVAPGISEALIATAMGLFAAIPAVIAYNRFSTQLTKIQEKYEIFEEEFTNILHREAYN
ncbi:MAG: protein TolQ [Coxiella sp. (in: Bacteria)]|nr:MAG: protein TolQ [Coxiella sp. (in: g-proteobacteria)]